MFFSRYATKSAIETFLLFAFTFQSNVDLAEHSSFKHSSSRVSSQKHSFSPFQFSWSISLRWWKGMFSPTEKFANCSPWKISEFCFPENVIKTIVLKPIFGHYEHTYFERGQEQQCLIIFVVSLFFGFLLKIEFDWIWEKANKC